MSSGIYPRTEKHLELLRIARSKITEESRRKIGLANKGKHLSPNTEFKKGQIPHNYGKTKYNYEPLLKASEKLKDKKPGCYRYWLGKRRPDVSDRNKIILPNIMKKKWENDIEYRRKMRIVSSNVMKNNWSSPEFKKKIEGLKDYFKRERTPKELNLLRKYANVRKGMKNSIEQNRKISEARLKQIIPTRDTVPERLLQQNLMKMNINFASHYPILGQPDIFIEPNICIFADGCYWHGCPLHFPKRRINERDERITKELAKQNYIVLRFWEHDILNNIDNCINKITEVISTGKSSGN